MYKNNDPEIGCGCILVILIISALIGAWLWPYTINTWLIYFGKAAKITHMQGALIGFIPFIGQATVPAAFITWVLMLFLV